MKNQHEFFKKSFFRDSFFKKKEGEIKKVGLLRGRSIGLRAPTKTATVLCLKKDCLSRHFFTKMKINVKLLVERELKMKIILARFLNEVFIIGHFEGFETPEYPCDCKNRAKCPTFWHYYT